MRQAQAAKNTITLKGSTEIVTEFFGYSINSILYQRGIYPPESFAKVNKYGLQMLVTNDSGLQKYLQQVLTQLSEWLYAGNVQKLVLVITSLETQQVLERWNFDIETEKDAVISDGYIHDKIKLSYLIQVEQPEKEFEKSERDIMNEIQVTVVYTDSNVEVPQTWEESDPKYINNQQVVFCLGALRSLSYLQEVRLRSFSTKVHKVDAMVAYKADDV
eukprot:767903-Hanusia_phi.AAC.11